MSGEVIVGRDGKPRCAWADVGDTAFGRYHKVWGTRTYDDHVHGCLRATDYPVSARSR